MIYNCRAPASLLCLTVCCVSVFYVVTVIVSDQIHSVHRSDEDRFHYAIIIDAGSSGSRLYMYRCEYNKETLRGILRITPVTNENGHPVVAKKSPGLSSFANNPTGAVEHVKAIIDSSLKYLPKSVFKQTSLFVLATAGMRLLSAKEQSDIMLSLKKNLSLIYDFLIGEHNIEIISGEWEGIYAWISINYIFGRFKLLSSGSVEMGSTPASNGRSPTAGIIDLGGASLQLAYEISQRSDRRVTNNSLIQEINLGCDDSSTLLKYNVFVNTYLGYGANTAIDRYEKWLAKSAMDFESNKNQSIVQIGDCCLPMGLKKTSNVELERPIELVRVGLGCYDACYESLRQLIVANMSCSTDQCYLEGVRLPDIRFSSTDFYGISEYWYCTNDVLNKGGIYNYTTVRQSSLDFCHSNWTSIWMSFRHKKYPNADVERIRTQCFKTAWAFSLLHDGFKFPKNMSKFYTVAKVGGHEIQWTLGAVLYRLRHLPLQLLNDLQLTAVDGGGVGHGHPWARSRSHHWLLQIMLFVGSVFLLLLLADFVLLHFCRRHRGFNIFDRLRRNPSFMNYMMVGTADSILPRYADPSSSRSPYGLL